MSSDRAFKELFVDLKGKQGVVIGAGIAGLTAAAALSRWGVRVWLIDKAPALGGHAIQLSCKAIEGCVQCGACQVHERAQQVARQKNITFVPGARIVGSRRDGRLELALAASGQDAGQGAGLVPDTLNADALLVTTGFTAYDPSSKPYGYGQFANVLTNLDAERILHATGVLARPSDGRLPRRMAFIQCVGSRDHRIGHNWCSKICCGSALRMARLVQSRQPGTAVTFFYIDVQSFGRQFQATYDGCRDRIRTVRAIPADIRKTADDDMQVTFFDPQERNATDAVFDLVVLSAGLTPSADNAILASVLGMRLLDNGFYCPHDNDAQPPGMFAAGAALGPMSIAESIDSAGKAAFDMVRYLDRGRF
jgi:heterodisulfide reductase subunit A